MFSLDHHPFRGRVRVAAGHPSFEFQLALREELDGQAVLDGPLGTTIPAKMGDHGPIDLHTGREPCLNQARRKALSEVCAVQTGPGDEHGASKTGRTFRRKLVKIALDGGRGAPCAKWFTSKLLPFMRDDYIKEALRTVPDPNILINVVSRRVKQLKRGSRPLVESLEKLSPEDVALREIIEGKISFETATA